jgi:hypothetical protein
VNSGELPLSVFLLILIVVLEIALVADVTLADRTLRPRGGQDSRPDRGGGLRRLWASRGWRAS